MEDRKASALAAVVGCAAVGGFWLARPAVPKGTIRIVERHTVPLSAVGPDRDAAVAFRLDLPSYVRERMEDGRSTTLQIVDRDHRTYPLVPMYDPEYAGMVKLPRGYSQPLRDPRIQVVSEGIVLASVSAGVLPPPVRSIVKTSPDPRIEVVYRGAGTLEARPRSPLARAERWHVVAERTSFTPVQGVVADLPTLSSRWQTQRLMLAYPESVDAIELDVQRFRMVERSETIVVPGLRIEPRFGGTAVVIDHKIDLSTHLGTRILVPSQFTGPRHPLRHGDPRVATVNIALFPQRGDRSEQERRSRARQGYSMRLTILSPSPEELGLRELRLGPSARIAAVAPTSPLRPRTFTATIKLTVVEPTPIGRFKATIPVTSLLPEQEGYVAPLPNLRGRPGWNEPSWPMMNPVPQAIIR